MDLYGEKNVCKRSIILANTSSSKYLTKGTWFWLIKEIGFKDTPSEPNGQVAQVKAQLESNTCNYLTTVKGMPQVQHNGFSYDSYPNTIVNVKFKVRSSYTPTPNNRVQPHHFVIIFHLYVIFSNFLSLDLLLFFSFNFFLALSLVIFPLILAMADLWHARVLL